MLKGLRNILPDLMIAKQASLLYNYKRKKIIESAPVKHTYVRNGAVPMILITLGIMTLGTIGIFNTGQNISQLTVLLLYWALTDYLFARCCYGGCYAECCNTEYGFAEFCYAECCYAMCCYFKCFHAKCCYDV
jgi:hypothetical protein